MPHTSGPWHRNIKPADGCGARSAGWSAVFSLPFALALATFAAYSR
jgi:hypothetical protein